MSFFDWIKVFELKPRYLLAVWLFGALLLLSPAYVSERFGFASIVTHYRGWIGLGTLAFFVLWVVQLTAILKDKKEKKARSKEERIRAQERRTEILKAVNTLSKNESFILLYSLHQNQQTVFAALSNRYAQAMCAKGLLKASPRGNIVHYPFTIPHFVWDYLKENEQILYDSLPEFHDMKELYEQSDGLIKKMAFGDL